MDILPLYRHRFDPVYLRMLAKLLRIENLKDSAIFQPRTIQGVEYKKCISIDFCGIAATTLFGIELDRPETTKANIEVRREVAKAFKKLFDKKVLKTFNDEGYYLKVRFCLSYLYSDFPVCLIKAEQPETWTNLADKPVDSFYINNPLNEQEFHNSNLRRAQEYSLIKIGDIYRINPDVICGKNKKSLNTLEIRFPAIPSPVCTLLINDKAFSDPYMYSKTDAEAPLSLSFPVIAIKNDKNSKIHKEHFRRILRHFNYLWRHDMTLFAGDGSNFTPEYPKGISSILHPDEVVGINAKNWHHKEKRIGDKIQEAHDTMGTTVSIDEKNVILWKENLTLKFKRSTRKIQNLRHPGFVKNDGTNTNKTKDPNRPVMLRLCMRRNTYFFNILFNSLDLECEWIGWKPSVLFYTLAHFGFATLDPDKRIPIIHKIYENKNGLKKLLSEQLLHSELGRMSKGPDMFDALFDEAFNFKISAENISITDSDDIAKVTYEYAVNDNKTFPKEKITGSISCLDYQIPSRRKL